MIEAGWFLAFVEWYKRKFGRRRAKSSVLPEVAERAIILAIRPGIFLYRLLAFVGWVTGTFIIWHWLVPRMGIPSVVEFVADIVIGAIWTGIWFGLLQNFKQAVRQSRLAKRLLRIREAGAYDMLFHMPLRPGPRPWRRHQ